MHNDQTVIVGMSFVGLIDADGEHSLMNPNKSLPQKRSGACLKEKFFAIRASTTRAFHNWTRSGRNNPEGCDFSNFVSRAPSFTGISMLGRYCIVPFYAMKCGTEEEDKDVLNFTSRILPYGAGYDDGDNENLAAPPVGDSRKQKRVLEDIVKESKARTKIFRNLSQL